MERTDDKDGTTSGSSKSSSSSSKISKRLHRGRGTTSTTSTTGTRRSRFTTSTSSGKKRGRGSMSGSITSIDIWRGFLGYPHYDPGIRNRMEQTKYIRGDASCRTKNNCVPVIVSDWNDPAKNIVLHVQKSNNNKTFRLFVHSDQTTKVRQGRNGYCDGVGQGLTATHVKSSNWYEINVLLNQDSLKRWDSIFRIYFQSKEPLVIRYARLYAEAFIDQTERRQNDIVEHTNDDWRNPVQVTFASQSVNIAKKDFSGFQRSENQPSSEMPFQLNNIKLTKLSSNPREQNQSSNSSSSSSSSVATSFSSSSSSSSDATSSSEIAAVEASIKWVQCTRCGKWRTYPRPMSGDNFTDLWTCNMNTWDLEHNGCEIEQEKIKASTQYNHPFLGGRHANGNTHLDRTVVMKCEAAPSYLVTSTFVADVDFVATVEIGIFDRSKSSYKYSKVARRTYLVGELSVKTNEEITIVRRNVNVNDRLCHIIQREMRPDETIDDRKQEEEEVNDEIVDTKRKRKTTQRFGAEQNQADVVTRDIRAVGSSRYRGLVPVQHIEEVPSPFFFFYQVDEFQKETEDFDCKILNNDSRSSSDYTVEMEGMNVVFRQKNSPSKRFTGIKKVRGGWVATFPIFNKKDVGIYVFGTRRLYAKDIYKKDDGRLRSSMESAARDYDDGMRNDPAYQVGNEGGVQIASHHRGMMPVLYSKTFGKKKNYVKRKTHCYSFSKFFGFF